MYKTIVNMGSDPAQLNWAVVKGHYQIVRVLLERGANVNLVDIYGNTALDSALRKKHEKIVDLLEVYGARPRMLAIFNFAWKSESKSSWSDFIIGHRSMQK